MVTWIQAKSICENKNSTLLIVDSHKKFQILKHLQEKNQAIAGWVRLKYIGLYRKYHKNNIYSRLVQKFKKKMIKNTSIGSMIQELILAIIGIGILVVFILMTV